MNNWEQFEEKCFSYLEKNFSNDKISFKRIGGHDSTKSDILCSKNNTALYYIDAKMPKAQSGQFVLFPDMHKKRFIFSDKSKSNEKYAQPIIEYLNQNFEDYKKPSTKKIMCDKSLFSRWIIKHYKEERKVEYIITQGEEDQYIIFPIEKLDDYFSINAVYRIKKSGSSNPSPKDRNELDSILQDKGYVNYSISERDKYTYAVIPDLDKSELIGKEHTFRFKKVIDNEYKVTRLSNTYNANVIFSIILRRQQDPLDIEQFKLSLLP